MNSALNMVSQVPAEPLFLRENWKRVLGDYVSNRRTDRGSDMQYVRVTPAFNPCLREDDPERKCIGTVANIANGVLLIRCMVPHQPVGLYSLGQSGELVAARPKFLGYPDTDLSKPVNDIVRTFCVLPRDGRDEAGRPAPGPLVAFARFVSEIRAVDGDVVLNATGAYMLQRPDIIFNYPFNIPGEGLTFGATYLELALKEAMRYDSVYFSREARIDRDAPLIIGLDWNNCVLITPKPPRA